MINSVAEGQSAENFGGFLSAINSVYNIEISIIEESRSDHGCVIFAEGKHVDPGEHERNKIYRANIRNNVCESSLMQVINTDLTIDRVYFNDNEQSKLGGTNGIVAVNSQLDLIKVVVKQSSATKRDDIKADVGFLSLFEGSTLIADSVTFTKVSAAKAGAIYSRGPNLITITGSDFTDCVTKLHLGALLDIEGAESVKISSTTFLKNEGAPVIRVANTNVELDSV